MAIAGGLMGQVAPPADALSDIFPLTGHWRKTALCRMREMPPIQRRCSHQFSLRARLGVTSAGPEGQRGSVVSAVYRR